MPANDVSVDAVEARDPRAAGGGVPPRLGAKLAVLFLLLTAALALGGYLYLERLQTSARAAAHHELSAIADLKADQIRNWREERRSDARFFSRARFVAQDVKRFLDNPDSEPARAAVLHWLNLLKAGERYYAAIIYDARLEQRLAIPDLASEPPTSVRAFARDTLRTRDVFVTDLHQDQTNGLIHLDVVFPIYDDAGPQRGAPLAFVLLKLDARQFLFPVVQSWPVASETAEALIVRREGDQVLFLNDLRHRAGTALALRVPLASPELPAAKVLRGETNAIEGVDYRGVPVVAVGRHIPESSWAMVAKVDQEEIYAPLRQQILAVVAVLGTLLIASALLVALLWRQGAAQFLARELSLEKERAALAERVAHLMRNANDIILLMDREGRVLEANAYALKTYGYTLPEMQQLHLRDLRAPESAASLDRDLERIHAEGAIVFETIHRRNDGSPFPVEVSSRKISVGGETYLLSIIRDITQRQAHEREIERLNRLYAAMSQVNQAVVRAGSRDELIREVCRVLVEFGGFQTAWVGWVDDTAAELVGLAQFGSAAEHLAGIRISPSDRAERCPIGTTIAENHPCICNDLSDGSTRLPWHTAAERAGWHSLAAFPIRQAGLTRGALAVFAQQQNFFGTKEQALLEEAAADVSFGLDTLLNDERRRRAEAALRALNTELDQRVRQRTADLEAKNKSLEAFTYSVSHDLKAPLRSIAGFTGILLQSSLDRLDEPDRQLLEKISQAAGRMKQLIDDLLAYSQLELQAVVWSEVDLRELAAELLEEYQPEILLRHTRVEMDVSCTPFTSDASGLTQALRNLVGNAIKFSAKAAQPQVRITARDEGAACLVEVRDNGIGFDQQYREKIFELFERVHTDKDYPGTGIG
ncbi:MAG TPA: PAS domain S-box protein, partial [Bacillota bacterium]|nr:PAS domain S-box protein [Bacillota bacterium]